MKLAISGTFISVIALTERSKPSHLVVSIYRLFVLELNKVNDSLTIEELVTNNVRLTITHHTHFPSHLTKATHQKRRELLSLVLYAFFLVFQRTVAESFVF